MATKAQLLSDWQTAAADQQSVEESRIAKQQSCDAARTKLINKLLPDGLPRGRTAVFSVSGYSVSITARRRGGYDLSIAVDTP